MKKVLSLILALMLFVSVAVPVNADLAEYETEDVYLLGDGESTRMSPGLFWDMAFTGKSTMKYAGRDVEVWHFPAQAKVGLDDWSYIPQITAYYQAEDVEIDESFHFEGGAPFSLPSADAIYCISLRDYEGKLCKQYYVKSEAAAASENGVSDWAKAELDAAKAAGLIPVLTDNPGYQDAITREQFAELVTRFASGFSGVMTPDASFTDCDNFSVLWAATVGIVNGVGDGKFAPKQTANREQIATMLHRAINHIKVAQLTNCNPIPLSGSIENYADKAEVSDWAAEGVGALAANGIMKGTSDTTLSPKNPCTVEQCIILIYRLYTKYTAN